MSIEAVSWALNEAPVEDDGPAAVLLGLANHADPDGRDAWPSVERLAYYARMSPRSVRRHLGKLLNDHVIEVDEDTRGRDAKTRADQRPTVYRLRMDRKRETFKERRDRQRRETEEALGGRTDCPPGQIDRPDNVTERDDSVSITGGQAVTQTVLEPPAEPTSPNGEGAQLALVPDPDDDPPTAKVTKRRSRLPENWEPTEAQLAYCREKAPHLDPGREAEKFKSHHLAAGKLMADWDRAWQYWVNNDKGGGRGGRRRQNYRNDETGQGRQGWSDFMQGGKG